MGLIRVDIYIIGEDNCEQYYIPAQMIPVKGEIIHLYDWRNKKFNTVKCFEVGRLKKIFDVGGFYIELHVM